MSKEFLKTVFGSYEGLQEMEIDGQFAAQLLNAKSHNRLLSERRINQYCFMMLLGKWVTNNDCIMFFDDGSLKNGQHRLWAVVRAAETKPEIKIRFIFMWGVKRKEGNNLVMDFLDRGQSRTGIQNWILNHYAGEKSDGGARIGSIINFLGRIFSQEKRLSLESYEIEMVYQLYKAEINSAMELRKQITRLSSAPILAAFVFACKVEPEKSLEFEDQFFSGKDLSGGNPILLLRNRILRYPFSGTIPRIPLFKETLFALKYHVMGLPLTRIQYSDEGFVHFKAGQESTIKKISAAITLPEEDRINNI